MDGRYLRRGIVPAKIFSLFLAFFPWYDCDSASPLVPFYPGGCGLLLGDRGWVCLIKGDFDSLFCCVGRVPDKMPHTLVICAVNLTVCT